MSLVSFAVRMATVYALRGRTLAGARVHDSPQNPLDAALDGHASISVFTGESTAKGDGRGLILSDQSFDVSIHIHLPSEVETSTSSGALRLKSRAAGGEAAFDLMWRQMVRALMQDEGVWPELWRKFVCKVEQVNVNPFIVETDKGVRVQAREIIVTIDGISEPDFGPVDGTLWEELLSAMRADPELSPLADALEYDIIGDATVDDFTHIRALLGLASDEIAAVGLGAAVGSYSGTLDSVAVNDDVLMDSDTSEALP